MDPIFCCSTLTGLIASDINDSRIPYYSHGGFRATLTSAPRLRSANKTCQALTSLLSVPPFVR
jgi:hypothetical protein